MTLTEWFILSKDATGGAYHYALSADGTLTEGNKTTIPHPMWGEAIGGRLCVCFLGDAAAENTAEPGYLREGYAEYSLTTGAVLGTITPTQGREVCHFSKIGGDIYLANYTDGSICHRTARGAVWLLGHTPTDTLPLGPDADRQESAHVHQCIPSPDGRYILVCDLGLDAVIVYDRDLIEVSHAVIPAGHGARHAVFSTDGRRVYVVGEMGASVTTFSWDNGILTREAVLALTPGKSGAAAAIVLSPDGRHLYITNRTDDTIIHCVIGADGIPSIASVIPSGGLHPRDFKLIASGHAAICCNQLSHSFTLFAVSPDGTLHPRETVSLPSPVCCCEL